MSLSVLVPTLHETDLNEYDFLDFGAGIGNSLEFCQKRFGAGRGLGIDIDRTKIRAARDQGREVVFGDIRELPPKTSVRFVSMMDFLEHLPDIHRVREILAVAVRCATDFLFIRHPCFDDEAYLASLGLRQYWHDWSGHPSHVLVSDFASLFAELDISAWSVRFKDPVFDSDHPSIIPLGAPRNQLAYDPERCGPKPFVRFAKPVFRQLDIIACLSCAGFEAAPKLLDAAGYGAHVE